MLTNDTKYLQCSCDFGTIEANRIVVEIRCNCGRRRNIILLDCGRNLVRMRPLVLRPRLRRISIAIQVPTSLPIELRPKFNQFTTVSGNNSSDRNQARPRLQSEFDAIAVVSDRDRAEFRS